MISKPWFECGRKIKLREKLNRGVSHFFRERSGLCRGPFRGLFLLGAVNRLRKRKRTNRENPRTIPGQIGKIPEKSGKSPKGKKNRTKKEGQVQIGKPPHLNPPRLAPLESYPSKVLKVWGFVMERVRPTRARTAKRAVGVARTAQRMPSTWNHRKPRIRLLVIKKQHYPVLLFLGLFERTVAGTGQRGHCERGLFAGEIFRISKISKFPRISRKWSESPFFSTQSGGSLETLEQMDFSQKTPFPKDPLFRTRYRRGIGVRVQGVTGRDAIVAQQFMKGDTIVPAKSWLPSTSESPCFSEF